MPKYAKSNVLLIVGGGILTAITILGTAIAALWFRDDLEDKGIPPGYGLAIGIALAMCCIALGFERENRRLRDKRGDARVNLEDKSATLKLARELDEMIPKSPWGDILSLRKKVHYTRGAPTVEQVEDVRHKLMDFLKKVRDKLVGTAYLTEFGYEDDSKEWAHIHDLDTSDVPGSLDTLQDQCQCFSGRREYVTSNMRQSVA